MADNNTEFVDEPIDDLEEPQDTEGGSDETDGVSDSEPDEADNTDEETPEDEEEPDEEKPEDDEPEGAKDSKKDEPEPELKKAVFKQVKAKYPELFKEFPELRHAFFREQEYSKLFTTVKDAEEAKSAVQNLEFINEELLEGRTENLLRMVANTDVASYRKLVENFLPTLAQLDRDSYYGIAQPVIEHALRAALAEGESTGNKNLKLAAQHVRRFLFGSHEFPKAGEEKPATNPEAERAIQERDSLLNSRRVEYQQEVGTKVQADFKSLVMDGLKLEGASEFTKNKIVEEVMSQVGNALAADENHMRAMSILWNRAARTLDPRLKARIAETYLTRAKELIPSIRAKVVAAAMGKTPTKPNTKPGPKRITGGGSPGVGKQKLDPKKIDWSQTSDMDILNGKPTFKK